METFECVKKSVDDLRLVCQKFDSVNGDLHGIDVINSRQRSSLAHFVADIKSSVGDLELFLCSVGVVRITSGCCDEQKK